jgi:very-short-patch-repair endonuclease
MHFHAMTLREYDHQIARLSRAQHGAWSRKQALAVGATRDVIRRRLDSGAWLELDTAVYGDPAVPPTFERSVMAAVLAEPWAVASHRSGAVLHRLKGFRQGRPEITVRPGANARGKLARIHRGVDVRTTTIDHIPAVTIGQVYVDLVQVVSEDRVRKALAARADEKPIVLDAVRDRYVALAPRGGRDLRPMKRILDAFGAGKLPTPTQLERKLRALAAAAALRVEWEAPFPGREAGRQRVDGLAESCRVVLEADGRDWHTRTQDFDSDRKRDGNAAAAGYLTLRFTWYQLTEEWEWCLDTLLSTVATRRVAA